MDSGHEPAGSEAAKVGSRCSQTGRQQMLDISPGRPEKRRLLIGMCSERRERQTIHAPRAQRRLDPTKITMECKTYTTLHGGHVSGAETLDRDFDRVVRSDSSEFDNLLCWDL